MWAMRTFRLKSRSFHSPTLATSADDHQFSVEVCFAGASEFDGSHSSECAVKCGEYGVFCGGNPLSPRPIHAHVYLQLARSFKSLGRAHRSTRVGGAIVFPPQSRAFPPLELPCSHHSAMLVLGCYGVLVVLLLQRASHMDSV